MLYTFPEKCEKRDFRARKKRFNTVKPLCLWLFGVDRQLGPPAWTAGPAFQSMPLTSPSSLNFFQDRDPL